jgi:hypothetical protein
VDDSVALSCLAGGSTAFVGATGVAYGGLDGPLVAADLLAQRFWRRLSAGADAGSALARAKAELASEALAQHGYVDAEEEKAVHNFVLYGDPSLTCPSPSMWAEDAASDGRAGPVEWAGPAAMVGTSPVRPQFSSAKAASPGGGPAPAGLVDAVRLAVARRLPDFGSGDVQVATSPLDRGRPGVAHDPSCEGPRRMVVTLTKSIPTAAGPARPAVVRVTVDANGAIRRLAVSR